MPKSRSNSSNRRAPTDKRTTHTDATKCITCISPATLSITSILRSLTELPEAVYSNYRCWWVVASVWAVAFVTISVCVFVHAVNRKWLKLSTPDLVDIKYMAVARHAWTDLWSYKCPYVLRGAFILSSNETIDVWCMCSGQRVAVADLSIHKLAVPMPHVHCGRTIAKLLSDLDISPFIVRICQVTSLACWDVFLQTSCSCWILCDTSSIKIMCMTVGCNFSEHFLTVMLIVSNVKTLCHSRFLPIHE